MLSLTILLIFEPQGEAVNNGLPACFAVVRNAAVRISSVRNNS